MNDTPGGRMHFAPIASEKITRERKFFLFDLIENQRGQSLKM